MSRARIDTARPVFIGEYREPKILPRTGFERDPKLIAEYEPYHEHVWPEIIESIEASGIEDMEIYRLGTRMFMVMEVNDQFSFSAKTLADQSNPKVADWKP